MRHHLCAAFSFVLCLTHAQHQGQTNEEEKHAPPSVSRATLPAAPPLPPAHVAPLPSFKRATLESSLHAPPASPPWTTTPAGKREEGRGWLLQQQLRDYIQKSLGILSSGEPLAVRAALSELSLLALESTITDSGRSSWLSAVHPIAFRKACISNAARSAKGSGSVVEAVARLVDDGEEETAMLALQCLEAIATDDPSTDADNHHALAICSTHVIPSIVRLLRSPSEAVRTRAAGVTAALVENAHCAKMFVGGGAVLPLLALGSYGSDACRQHAFRSLRMLALDRDAREAIVRGGGKELVEGLARHGSQDVRVAAAEFAEVLEARVAVSVDASGHARAARATRVAQSKLWSSHVAAGSRRVHNARIMPGLGASRVLTEREPPGVHTPAT